MRYGAVRCGDGLTLLIVRGVGHGSQLVPRLVGDRIDEILHSTKVK